MKQSLDRIGKPAVGDFSTNMVTNFFATPQLLSLSTHKKLNPVSFIIFDRVDRIFDVLDSPSDYPPGRTRRMAGMVRHGRGMTFDRR